MARQENVRALRHAAGALLALLLLIGFPQAARAQVADDALRFSERLPATGARMTALGGAGIGGFADYTMLFTNPAGLGYFEASQAAGTLGLLRARDEAVYEVPQVFSAGQDQSVSDYGGNFALVYSFPTSRGSLVFGAGLNQVNTFERELGFGATNSANSITTSFLPFDDEYAVGDDGVFFPDNIASNRLPFIAFEAGAIEFFEGDFDAGEYPFEQAVLPGTSVGQSGRVTEEGRMSEANFGGAVEASKGLMLGLSANVVFGTYRFENFIEEDDQGQNADYVVIRNGVEYAGLRAVQFRSGFESDLVGGNLRAGLSAALTPGLRAGLTVETPTFYRVEETYTLASITTFFSQGGTLSYGDQPGDVGRSAYEYRVRTPWRLGGGLVLNAATLTGGAADLTLALDAEFVDWTQLEINSDFDDFSDTNRAIRDDYDAVVNTRLGAELMLGGVALRGGFAYQPDPRSDEISGGVDRSKTYLSAGLGYAFDERVMINLGYAQQRFEDRYVPYADPDIANPPIANEDVRRNFFLLGLTYSF